MNDDAQIKNDDALLEAGDDMPALESGDDVAAQALAEASQRTLPSPTSGAANDPAALAQTLTSLQNVIERNANELDRIKEMMKQYREELKNVFENDAELADAEEKVTQLTQQVKEKKTKIQNSPQVIQIKASITELNEQKKEIEEALNNHLLNLYQVTGTKTFDTSDGQQREFNIKATLKGGGKKAEN